MYVGPFMTSLDMAGFSLSVCALDAERAAALDADTQVGRAVSPDQWMVTHVMNQSHS